MPRPRRLLIKPKMTRLGSYDSYRHIEIPTFGRGVNIILRDFFYL